LIHSSNPLKIIVILLGHLKKLEKLHPTLIPFTDKTISRLEALAYAIID